MMWNSGYITVRGGIVFIWSVKNTAFTPVSCNISDWIEQCFTYPPTQYRLYGRRFLQVKRRNQQYQSTEGTNSTQTNQTYNKQTWTQNTASPLVYNNMGWLGDGSHRGQGCQAWTAVGLLPRYPRAISRKWYYRGSGASYLVWCVDPGVDG